MDQSAEFKLNGYLYIKDLLPRDSCIELAKGLKVLVDEKKTTKDHQCPKSEAIGGSAIFNSLLGDLTPRFETITGLKLYPTYSYARFYDSQNEELKIHLDRPSCEISISLTLDFEGEVWPLCLGHKGDKSDSVAYKMNIGDGLMYRGLEIYHWREPYKEGKWQAQVFLHYVDQNGPHAEWKYDKHESL